MARRKVKVSPAQSFTGYSIIALLGLIVIGMLFRQAYFNPAVKVVLHAPLSGKMEKASGQASAALFPEVSGFTPLAPVESFGPDNLSDKIDGKAELYLPAGFKEMSCRKFGVAAAEKAYLEVFLYDMGSPQNAFAVFSSQRRPGSPNSPLTTNAYSTSNALFFTRGKYYVEIVADRASEKLTAAMGTYAKALLARLPAGEGQAKSRDPRALFPKEGLAPDTLRLCATDTFCLEGLNNVLTGEYNLKSGKATGFIAQRDSLEASRAEAKRYVDFLIANGYKRIEPSSGDFQVLVLDNSYEIVFVMGKFMMGVHDATTLEAAVELATKMKNEMKGAS